MEERHFDGPVSLSQLWNEYEPSRGAGVVQACIPAFFLTIVCEFLLSLINRRKVYRLSDTFNSLGFGMFQQLMVQWYSPIIMGLPYEWIYRNHRCYSLSDSWMTFIIIFIMDDFLYYWGHRISHECNLWWTAHSIHHSSEDFNLATALRQAAFQSVWFAPLYLPMAYFGVHPSHFILHSELNTVLQFWIHTQFVDDLGYLEYLINTPLQHRNHHARAPGLCNCNYSGVLSIWDQMFGTFDITRRPRNFGICKPNQTWNPVTPNFTNILNLFHRASKKSGSVSSKIRVLGASGRFDSQEFRDSDWESQYRFDPYGRRQSIMATVHIFLGLVMILLDFLVFGLMNEHRSSNLHSRIGGTLYLTYSLCSLGWFCDGVWYGTVTEFLRCSSVVFMMISDHMIVKLPVWLGWLLGCSLPAWTMVKDSDESKEANDEIMGIIYEVILVCYAIMMTLVLVTVPERLVPIEFERKKHD